MGTNNYRPCNNMDLIMELCYYKSEIILPSWPSNHLTASTMTSCSATGVRRVAGFQGRSVGLARRAGFSTDLLNPRQHTDVAGRLVLAVLHCLGFSKHKLLLEGDCENRGVLRAHLKRNQSFSVSFYEKFMMGIFFSSFLEWRSMRWERGKA